MHRFERFAQEILTRLDHEDLATLLETLSDDEVVRLLVGMTHVNTDDLRLRRNIVGTHLQNRVLRLHTLVQEALTPPQQRDLGSFTAAIARALRVEMACIDEVRPNDEFALHGHYRLPPPVMETERCHVSKMAMCEHVLRTGTTLHVPDIATDPRWRTAPAYTRHGLLHYAGAPGFAPDGRVRCVVWVADRRPRSLLDEEVELLERLAQRVAEEFETLAPLEPARAASHVALAPQRQNE